MARRVGRAGSDIDHVVPIGEGHFPEISTRGEFRGDQEGVVDQDIEPPLVCTHPFEKSGHCPVVAMIAGGGDSPSSGFADFPGRGFDAAGQRSLGALGAASGDIDRGAGGPQFHSTSPANSPAPTGDYCDSTL